MVIIPWNPPLTKDELGQIASPELVNQPEVIPWALYDSFDIATAAAGPFVLFTALNADKTLCNMQGPGQLPDPQYFVVHYAAVDPLVAPTATALANEPNAALADVENIFKTCRATFSVSISDKLYGPFPLTFCHGTGGASFSGYGYGTAANGTSSGVVNSGNVGSGGFPFSGALVIPPKVGFSVQVNLGTAATQSATRKWRFSLVGALYRRVL